MEEAAFNGPAIKWFIKTRGGPHPKIVAWREHFIAGLDTLEQRFEVARAKVEQQVQALPVDHGMVMDLYDLIAPKVQSTIQKRFTALDGPGAANRGKGAQR